MDYQGFENYLKSTKQKSCKAANWVAVMVLCRQGMQQKKISELVGIPASRVKTISVLAESSYRKFTESRG